MHVDKDACRSRGLIVTNAGAAFAADLADHAPCGLDSRRQAPEGGRGRRDAYIHSGRWPANTRRRLPSRQQGEQQAGEDRGAGPLQTLPCRVPFPLGGIFYD